MKIDTHQHFWKYSKEEYPWIGEGMELLAQDRLPADLNPLLKENGIDGTITVQARQVIEETEALLAMAEEYDFIRGVVGWVDLRNPNVEAQLERFKDRKKLVGVRHVVQDESDDNFVLRDDFTRGIGKLKAYGLVYDILIFPHQLEAAIELVNRFPEQVFILDHIAKPYIKDKKMSPWDSDIKKLASFKNVSCKISGMVTEADWHNWNVEDFKPFDPVSKRTEASVHDDKDRSFKVSKGAPQVILSLLEDRERIRQEVETQVDTFASSGERALGVAKTDDAGTWRYVGLVALSDSPRDDSAETIAEAEKMGVQVKMVTGDHTAIAREIAQQVNLGTNIKSVSSFMDKSDREAIRVVEEADGFAEVFPEHKYHIVELLQSRDHIVGMTGDGVNDAPALKKADVGIAVAGATDAAKSAASIVFTRPGLSVIIDALKTSRRIFERMNSYAIYRIAETIRVLLFLTMSILMFKVYPVTAIMIVILALLNDLPIMMIAYDHTKLAMAPVRWEMRKVLSLATLLGIFGVIESFIFLLLARDVMHLNQSMLQTIIFLKLAVAGHMTIYLARTGEHSFWTRPLPSAQLFVTSELTQVVATLFAVYGILMTPIGWKLAGYVWGYALIFFLLANLTKIGFYRLIDHAEVMFSRIKMPR